MTRSTRTPLRPLQRTSPGSGPSTQTTTLVDATIRLVLTVAVPALVWSGCSDPIEDPTRDGHLEVDTQRPSVAERVEAPEYTGDNEFVLEAQRDLPTGMDLQRNVIQRTCGPTGGVCHNAKEYPDLHTPANFADAVGAPCNVQSGTPESVYDGCERPGDRFQLGNGKELEVGYLEYVPGEYDRDSDGTPDAETPGLHLYFADVLSEDDDEMWDEGRFIRAFVNEEGIVEDLAFFTYDTRWVVVSNSPNLDADPPQYVHLFGEVPRYKVTDVQELLSVGVVQGDLNRNGRYGARHGDPLHMIEPGDPEASYLVGRLRGALQGEDIPGSRMPLANTPLSVPEMLALYCFIAGLPTDGTGFNLASDIDYANCRYSDNPENLNLLGEGVTWQRRIRHILEFNCGGCHSSERAEAGLNLKDEEEPGEIYARLLQPSSQDPDLDLVEPGAPDESYLYLKLTGDERIIGSQMPLNPITGEGMLSESELDDTRTWIEAGAVEDQ